MGAQNTGNSRILDGELYVSYKRLVEFVIEIKKIRNPSKKKYKGGNIHREALIELNNCAVNSARNYCGTTKLHLPFSFLAAKRFNGNVQKFLSKIPTLEKQLKNKLKSAPIVANKGEENYAQINTRLSKLIKLTPVFENEFIDWCREIRILFEETKVSIVNTNRNRVELSPIKDLHSFLSFTDWTICLDFDDNIKLVDLPKKIKRVIYYFGYAANYYIYGYKLSTHLSIHTHFNDKFTCLLEGDWIDIPLNGKGEIIENKFEIRFFYNDYIEVIIVVDIRTFIKVCSKNRLGSGTVRLINRRINSTCTGNATFHQSLGSNVETMIGEIMFTGSFPYEKE